MEPQVTRLGNFTLERKLGVGGFATVWLARDEGLESWVAIKVLADNLADDPQVRARFVAEARILRELDYRRIVRVLQVGERDDGRPYFVMDYADGGTLDDRIRRNHQSGVEPSASEAADLATKICEGLAVAHSHGVVHRDLKPSNVLFRQVDAAQRQALLGLTSEAEPPGEELLLADFGIARRLEAATQAQSRYGTLLYMAPEQFSGGGDHRVDIYSAAVVLHQFITGKLPFPNEGEMLQLMAAKAEGRVVNIRDRRPDLSPGLDTAIQLALSPDPEERPDSALGWARAVRQAVDEPTGVDETNPSEAGLATRNVDRQPLPTRERVPTSNPWSPATAGSQWGTKLPDGQTLGARPQEPQRSRSRWRKIVLCGVPFAATALYFVVAALADLPPFSSSSRPLPTIALPNSWDCTDTSPSDPGATRDQTCSTTTLPSPGTVDVRQFDNTADRDSALNSTSMLGGFQPTSAGGSCPPPAGVVNNAQNATTQGLVRQPTPGIGELRCYTPNAVGAINGPEYDWTAQISGSSVLLSASAGQNVNTFAMLNYWWNGGHPDGLQYETTTGR